MVSDGIERARASIDSGAANGILESVIAITNREATRMETQP